ncbi:hypothetical protein [Limnoglobus roseus]|uniref:Uncharacterized protein n=1 Tax=Limnoglobus roseus TaxID=2598579 RepID=A0A5C1AMF7_9BACT|nr:hypothetical protein [Limnoglobus roseus]QEL18912.1 hypothetical protein PX52LOC_05962 [Limnoglobus roseus]
MDSVPTFTLSSPPVEFDVVRPADVRLRVKRPLKVHQKTAISEVFDIQLMSRSREPASYLSPTLG